MLGSQINYANDLTWVFLYIKNKVGYTLGINHDHQK